ncbi:hypothetical protein GLAREA_04894 [Glarea lozoyensis ATCC 20868]|uniref:Extracellular membrane protein CFEM domain-containing protein n=1 Tax=Glarea lozoyensis (strain ATCC 20868 / MF5171) TaxID=1116229 RepID=S3DNP7_GLAL2|nr:uncharacterized protein GLAREA_04894 [Glarea lozoyensis ATCC 20868]EPE28103.1 hypothetical protein GLAREA_04894 [Glarea lozoyensis ATCC 20868]
MHTLQTTLTTAILLLTTLITAQQAADGALVPFTSVLPACASQCGPLYDVQGGCTTQACFCGDARLASLSTGGATAASTICGAASCTVAADQQKIADWYKSFCPSNAGTGTGTTTAAGVPGATSTAGGSTPTNTGTTTVGEGNTINTGNGVVVHGSWFSTHWQYVVMLIILIVAIVGGWIGACIWRRAYLRKRERQYELRPPAIPWAPAGPEHHMAGGLQRVYGPGVGMGAGGHAKEMRSTESSTGGEGLKDPEKGGVRGFLRKGRS